jgi:hypothetical protein
MSPHVDGFPPEGNYAFLHRLLAAKAEIETAYDGPLRWDLVEGRKHEKVVALLPAGGYRDEDRWPSTVAAMLDAMQRLDTACRPFLAIARRAAVAVPRGFGE